MPGVYRVDFVPPSKAKWQSAFGTTVKLLSHNPRCIPCPQSLPLLKFSFRIPAGLRPPSSLFWRELAQLKDHLLLNMAVDLGVLTEYKMCSGVLMGSIPCVYKFMYSLLRSRIGAILQKGVLASFCSFQALPY